MKREGYSDFRATCPECSILQPAGVHTYCYDCGAALVFGIPLTSGRRSTPPKPTSPRSYREGGRYVVREIEGLSMEEKGRGRSCTVLDTRVNYRLVAEYRTEDFPEMHNRFRYVREAARTHAARLNKREDTEAAREQAI